MLENGRQLGRYRILSAIGAGGMGEVFLAEDTQLRRKVALKVLPENIAQDKERLGRFEREAFAASALNHPNILTIFEFAREGDTHFLASEFVAGETLRERLEKGNLTLSAALEITLQVASALQAAHSAGIVHRDIKPENVMIREDGYVKVLDFGLAKLLEQAPAEEEAETKMQVQTQAGMIMGTVAYMSPEQARGKETDARTDIFSLGVVLYEMLARRQPFTGETINHTIVAILEKEPPPVSEFIKGCPFDVESIVRKVLAKKRQERYQSARELCEDLKDAKQELEFQSRLERTSSPDRKAESPTQIIKAATTAEEKYSTGKIQSENSILVLPFTNISTDEENEYFSDGLTEELISDLSKIRVLRVISRNSAMRLKGTTKDTKTIAGELRVRYILDGSVRKAGQSLRISVQLIDGERDTNLWSEKYTGTLEDIFEMQESVSRSIVEALEITLSAEEHQQMAERPIADARAFDLYLRARAKLMQGNPAALDRSIELLRQGLDIIGENELLYAALGYTYYFYFKWISKLDENYLRQANECMQKVFALNPASTHGYSLKGFLSYSEGDIVEAIQSLKKAVEIEPTNAEALLWLTIYSEYFEDNRSEAMKYADAVRQIDPLLPANTLVKAFVCIYSGEFGAEPLSLIERGFEMDTSAPLSIWLAIIGKAWCGKTDEAVAHTDRLAEIAPGWIYTEHALFLKHALRGEKQLALRHYTPDFEKEAEYDSHFALHVAHCFALIGEKEKALDFLALSVRKGMLNYSFIGKYDPLLENIRGERRFKDLIEEAKKLSAQINGKSADLEIQDKPEEAGTLILQATATAEKSRAQTTGSEEGFWVAVLPFKYRGANSDLEDLAEGLSEEIVTGLSRFPYLQVIARSSLTARFSTDEFADVRSIGTQLGVRYVLEGSLRQSGSSVRLATQLVDTTTGRHLWAETYDRTFQSDEIFAIQDELVPRIVSTVADQHGVLVHSITDAIRKKDKKQITPSEAVMRVFSFHERMTAEEHGVVRDLLERVVSEFPNEGNVWAMLETLYCDEYMFGFNPLPDPLGRALAAAQRAVENAPTSNLACQALAQAHFFRRELEAFRPLAERTIVLNRMDGATVAFMGVLIACSGEWERGCQVTEQAMRLNPHFPGWYRLAVLFDAYRRSAYRTALAEAQKINIPNYFWKLVLCAAANGQLGESERARESLKELLAARPDFTEAAPAEFGRWFDAELVEHLMDGLRKAGLKTVPAPDQGEQKNQILNAQTKALPPEGETQNSIAVLPFTNISADEENEYFCDGLAEELLNALSKIEDLRVAARTSAFSFKGKNANASEIGKALNVNTILEGSVRRSGNRLRISVQLVNAANGFQLWSEKYDRELKDVFVVQDEIALAVVDKLKVKLFGDEKEVLLKHYTDNTEAYELYLKGRFFWSKLSPAGLEKAIECFKKAVSIEPDFAPAFAGLADAYEVLSQVSAVPVQETMPKAKAYAEKALLLDADLAEAHVSLGLVLADYDYDFVAAEAHYKTAIRLKPHNPTARQLYGQLLAQLGRHQEAEAEFLRAIKIDPLSITFNWHYGFGLFEARRYDEALLQLEKTFEMDSGFLLTQWVSAAIHQARGDYAEAAESFAKFYDLADNSEDAARVRKSFAAGGWSGFVRMMTGNEPPADVTGYLAAALHASLGEKDAAFAELEKAYGNREALLPLIKIDPRVDSLRDDPRYAEMLNRIGFPPEKANQTDESLEVKTVMLSSGELKTERSADSKTQNESRAISFEKKTNPKSAIRNSKSKWWLFGLLGFLVLVGGFFGYQYLSPNKQIESIAVMPFVNESGNADNEYLSDGMTETLIKSLSQLPNLNVKPRTSVFRYKGKDTDLQTIARELNVQAILNGRVVQRGEQLTLSLELIDVQKDSVIWTESYNRKQSDIVSLQSEIARDVSSKLKTKLSGAEESKVTKTSTTDPEAYQAYLKGRYYWNRRTAENLKKAIEQFKLATDRDPNYALAFAGLADCYVVLHEYAGTPTSETVPQAKTYAERALSLDSQLAEPHVALGAINDQLWQWAEAEKEFKTAIELNPNYPTSYHWYSMLLKNLVRYDEAAAMIRRAQELDPLSSVIGVNVSRMYLELQNNPAKSVEVCLKVIELDPNFAPAHEYLGLSYLKQGRRTEAVAALEKAAELSNREGNVLSNLGYAYAATGKRTEAIAVAKELEDKYARKEANAQFIAAVYAGLGEKDKAFEWLEKDFQTRNGKLAQIRWTFSLKPLSDDPRFKDLLKRMNLPE